MVVAKVRRGAAALALCLLVCSVVASSAGTLAAAAPVVTPPVTPAVAPVSLHPDLTVTVSGPANATVGEAFEFVILVRNVGMETADSSTFLHQITGAVQSFTLAATCESASGGATCPTRFTIGTSSITATLPTIPALGEVRVVISGVFGVGTSLSSTTSVQTVGSEDSDLSSNTATQSTALENDTTVTVTKTADQSTIDNGGTVTFTMTVTNHGPAWLREASLTDVLTVGAAVDVRYSVNCAAESTAPCPTWANGVEQSSVVNATSNILYFRPADLPPGSTLVLTIPMTMTRRACGPASMSIYNVFRVEQRVGIDMNTASQASSATMTGGVPCPTASIRTLKSVDREQVAVGGTVNYTATITNNGPSDMTGFQLIDEVSRSLTTRTNLRVAGHPSCAAGTTIDCPAWLAAADFDVAVESGETDLFRALVDLPVGETLVLALPVTFTQFTCDSVPENMIRNPVRLVPPANFTAIGVTGSAPAVKVTGLEVCPVVNVTVAKSGPAESAPGEPVTYQVSWTNNSDIDISEIYISDKVSMSGGDWIADYHVVCAASSTAACPLPATGEQGTVRDGDTTVFGQQLPLPAGTTLAFEVTVTPTFRTCVSSLATSIQNQADIRNPPFDITLAGVQTVAVKTALGFCNDVTVNLGISSAHPPARQPAATDGDGERRCRPRRTRPRGDHVAGA